ncbi:hypothetical protein KFE98_18465 [bacterium SCSIO 12741]|nr:hypothetical protein KFE98_18465 [bacterium SCSIO 12741]
MITLQQMKYSLLLLAIFLLSLPALGQGDRVILNNTTGCYFSVHLHGEDSASNCTYHPQTVLVGPYSQIIVTPIASPFIEYSFAEIVSVPQSPTLPTRSCPLSTELAPAINPTCIRCPVYGYAQPYGNHPSSVHFPNLSSCNGCPENLTISWTATCGSKIGQGVGEILFSNY